MKEETRKRIEELERRVRELEARPPQVWYPQQPQWLSPYTYPAPSPAVWPTVNPPIVTCGYGQVTSAGPLFN